MFEKLTSVWLTVKSECLNQANFDISYTMLRYYRNRETNEVPNRIGYGGEIYVLNY
jgi:hypothetical protein